MNKLIAVYVTLFPIIITGALNMLFCKSKLLDILKKPIDNNKNFSDGKRIFGDNKTYKGFIGMIFIGGITQVIWYVLIKDTNLFQYYLLKEYNIYINLIFGLIEGFIYMISELPNSFIKRRLDIIPGKLGNGTKGFIFFVFDQIDSLLGVISLLVILMPMSIEQYIFYVCCGGITHVIVNNILFLLGLRKNRF